MEISDNQGVRRFSKYILSSSLSLSLSLFLSLSSLYLSSSLISFHYYSSPPDYCPPDTTEIPSPDGDPNLRLTIKWPEILYGRVQNVNCPCDFQLSSTALLATRNCGGNLITGAAWERPNIRACNFSVTTRQLCRLANVREKTKLINCIRPITC